MLGNQIREKLQALRDHSRQALLLAEDHVDLFSLEWRAERGRLVAMSVSVIIGVAAGFLALAFGAAAVLAVFWDTPHRIVTAIGIAGAFAAIFLVTLARIVVLMDARRRSFARSRQEWALTWQSLKERL